MSDKRKVTTDALETLGTIIEDGGRDAIHLAVEPVIAGETLKPGQDIGIVDGKAFHSGGKSNKWLGIVDPFINRRIEPGEKFWLVVYPRQITSLRHVWSHPDFPEDAPRHEEYNRHELWIRNYAASIPLRYEDLMHGADQWVESRKGGGWGEYLCYGGLLEGEYVPDEFWEHYEAIRNVVLEDDQKGSFFTCSC